MHDMHCHLAFMSNGEDVAAEAQAENTLLFANTVTMDEYETARKRFEAYDNVRVGLGTHPWWVDDSFDAARFEKLANRERFIGEIGLDLGRRHEENRQAQLDAFNTAIGICAHQENKVVSLHAVHASAEVLGALERTGAGCRFSVGPRMLATGKGREYVKAIPAQHLLLETDAPPQQGQRYSYAELRAELEGAADTIAAIKGESALEIIEQNARTLLA